MKQQKRLIITLTVLSHRTDSLRFRTGGNRAVFGPIKEKKKNNWEQ
jgi:hypothetical protein